MMLTMRKGALILPSEWDNLCLFFKDLLLLFLKRLMNFFGELGDFQKSALTTITEVTRWQGKWFLN